MDRRRRNRLCIWIATLGLANLAVYTVVYGAIGGDAVNGEIRDDVCYVRGHFLRVSGGMETPVSRGLWIYSYVHSISLWPTHAAVLLSMLVLARPHIIATMKDGLITGPTFVTMVATLVIAGASVTTLWFVIGLIRQLN